MFSVVIPLYNKAHTIAETLRSVLDQDCSDFEIIVVDDGSTDPGMEIVEREFPDPRIRVIRQDNRGAAAARNRGVADARHELIAFLDGDDLWEPGYLSAMREAAERFPDAGLYCCAGTIRHSDGSGYLRFAGRYGEAPRKVRFFAKPWFFSHTSSNVVRRTCFYRSGGFPEELRHFEDQVLFHKVALIADVVFCPRPLAVRRKDVPGQVSAAARDAYRDRLERTNITYAYWAGLGRDRRVPRFHSYALNEFRCQLNASGDDPAKVRYLLAHVDPRLLDALGPVERLRYPHPALQSAAVVWRRVRLKPWRLLGGAALKYRRNLEAAVPRKAQ